MVHVFQKDFCCNEGLLTKRPPGSMGRKKNIFIQIGHGCVPDNVLVSLQWREDLPCSQHRTHRHRWMKFLTEAPYCQSDECQRFNDVVSGTGGFLLLHIRLCCRDVRIVVEPLFHLISCSRMIWTHQWKGSLLQAFQARQRFPSGCKALSTLMWSPT